MREHRTQPIRAIRPVRTVKSRDVTHLLKPNASLTLFAGLLQAAFLLVGATRDNYADPEC